ncbi:MAG: hypothetical protein NC489_24505, partial [Ruminococcus flavefaciens]|nr:hypothetical protein [Ruminococcus flavefaciens]
SKKAEASECTISEASLPILCSEMCHIEEYADKPDRYGLLIHSMESYERIKKWDGQILSQDGEKPCDTVLCITLRTINLYVTVSLDCYSGLQI